MAFTIRNELKYFFTIKINLEGLSFLYFTLLYYKKISYLKSCFFIIIFHHSFSEQSIACCLIFYILTWEKYLSIMKSYKLKVTYAVHTHFSRKGNFCRKCGFIHRFFVGEIFVCYREISTYEVVETNQSGIIFYLFCMFIISLL